MASSRNSPSEAVAARVAARIAPGTTLCAGLSGGLDSVVLLDLLAGLRESARFTLSAVHVHHGLSPNADAWAEFCAAFCRARGIPLAIERVHVARESGRGIEAAARAARHDAFAKQGAEVIALAHHLDDQAETVLLQLLRGTGLKGAAAMPEWRVLPGTGTALFRPLLEVARAKLEAHAREHGLAWVEDESNASTAFDRNFLRARVAPLLAERFPAWPLALARFARHAAGADALLSAEGEADDDEPGLPVAELRALPPAQQAFRLRAFLEAHGLPMPPEARLGEMARQLAGARDDARVRVEHAGVALVRHRDRVRIDRGERAGAPWEIPWSGEPEVALGEGRGTVRFAPAPGQGIAERYTHDRGWHFGPRDGGERIRVDAARPTRTLKNLLQEHDVPAWERDRLPLLFHAGALVWVPGIGIAAGYRCGQDEPGYLPQWFPAP
jgi:tRNA(Ile)-lysidine synthase